MYTDGRFFKFNFSSSHCYCCNGNVGISKKTENIYYLLVKYALQLCRSVLCMFFFDFDEMFYFLLFRKMARGPS